MKNRYRFCSVTLLLAVLLAAGCAKRQMTQSQTDMLDAVGAKITKAEQMGARECAPRELAYARAEYDHARHEANENWEKAQPYILKASKAADDLLEKTRLCVEAKRPKTSMPAETVPAPTPAPPPEPGPAAAPPEEATKFANIRFDFDKSLIRADAKPILAAVANYLKKNRGAKLLIEGHCDERGTAEYNMALGDRRATAAMNYLAALGVEKTRLSTISYGEERPLDPGHNEEAWANNRRGVFVLK